jgi:peroxiredoxin
MSTNNKSRPLRWFSKRNLAHLLLFIVIVAGIRVWQQRDMVGGTAPSLQGTLLDGNSYVLPAKPAQPVLVHFWATWCSICRAEQDSISALAHDQNVITVALHSGSQTEVAQHLKTQDLHFPVLNDPDGRLAAAWGVHAVPASFIIATDGQIHFVEVGYTTGMGLRFRLWMAGILS